jgi:hypothetical protein
MSKTKKGANLQFPGTSKSLSYLGGGKYGAWSGIVEPNSSTVTALDFNTENANLIANVIWGVNWDDHLENAYIGLEIKLAGQLVYLTRGEMTNQTGEFLPGPVRIGPFAIPRLTNCTIEVVSSSGAVDQYVMLEATEING